MPSKVKKREQEIKSKLTQLAKSKTITKEKSEDDKLAEFIQKKQKALELISKLIKKEGI